MVLPNAIQFKGIEMIRAQLSKLSVRIYAIVVIAVVLIAVLTEILLNLAYNSALAMREQHLSDVVDTAIATLIEIDDQAKAGALTHEQAITLGQETMMKMRYGESGYFFVLNNQNIMIAHPIKPELNGTDQTDIKDTHGTYIFQEMIEIATTKGRGALTYYFDKPDGSGDDEKISFVREYEPWGWIIGTGSYMSDINDDLADMRAISHGVLAAALIALGLASTLLVRSVTHPLDALKARMSAMSQGDTHTEVPMTNNKSEIGEMARVLEIFRVALVERAELAQAQIEKDAAMAREREDAAEREHQAKLRESAVAESRRKEQEKARQEKEAERADAEAERERNLRNQQHVVSTLAAGLGAMSRGDLTVRIKEDFPPEYVKLRTDFNDAVEKISRLASTIVEGAATIIGETDNLNSAAIDLSRRTETQAASLEETAAAITELAASVDSSARSAKDAAGTVGQTKDRSTAGRHVVQRTVKAMNDIAESSTQISKITSVIDDIAFQTNLLALNAGVEAARAGDSGRGFAVVASEVRALAQRSSEAANEIAKLIETSGRQVDEGVQLVNASGDALAEIETLVASLDGLVQTISTSASEQAVGLAEISTAVSQLDQVTQHNAAMFEETTAALQSLKAQATALERDSSVLKTTNEGEEVRLAS
ncbi:MAG: cache domain-containing protein [Alphaproteobacteria bacterium]|nr:cache domain-containing protein [Alphaproteobacteria bacterium]MBU1279288.1 cache domain-containing protein [Alphaproteobacteria bacterium]MBU1572435.1 cache domain-containing protein [Alphaproteobacteria bacterium]MBU1830212.1 cache domain-containing protein [Alphaproteobacteria bacterium]MBU2079440.1 cache domain-containing protein [Alphaproteobacteria bacterium]